MSIRRFTLVFLVIVGILMAGYGTAWVASPDVRFISRAGMEETQILQSRRPIGKMLKDPKLDPDLRNRLQLVLDVRDYAATLGFAAGKTYTTYADVGRDTLLLVLSASPEGLPLSLHLEIPGRGPAALQGLLRPGRRRGRKPAVSSRQGYDIYLRPSAAFSTLGWFQDPLLSTAVEGDTVELAATVFHEIAHNTLYVKSATPFNESFAQLAGYRAAEAFFRSRGDTASAQRAADRWLDEVVLGEYYDSLAARLDTLYHRAAGDTALVDAGRLEAAQWARQELEDSVGPKLRTYQVGRLPDRPVNNARIIAARIYRTRLALFERWYEEHGNDIAASVAALSELEKGAEGDEAFERLEQAAAGSGEQGAGSRKGQ